MGWNEIDNKFKKKYDKQFVSCEEVYEREYIINLIMENFSDIPRERIEKAISQCCKELSDPRETKDFWECLSNKLGYKFYW